MKLYNPFANSSFVVKVLFFLYVYSIFAALYMIANPTVGRESILAWNIVQVVAASVILILFLRKHPKTWINGICEQVLILAVALTMMDGNKDLVKKAIHDKTLEASLPALSPEELDRKAESSLKMAAVAVCMSTSLTAYLWFRSRKYFEEQPTLSIRA